MITTSVLLHSCELRDFTRSFATCYTRRGNTAESFRIFNPINHLGAEVELSIRGPYWKRKPRPYRSFLRSSRINKLPLFFIFSPSQNDWFRIHIRFILTWYVWELRRLVCLAKRFLIYGELVSSFRSYKYKYEIWRLGVLGETWTKLN